MRKFIVLSVFLCILVSGYSQVAKLPSSVNMSNSNGVAYNYAIIDFIDGTFEIGESFRSNFKYKVVDMTPIYSNKKQNYEVIVVDFSGERIKYSLTIADKVIEKLVKLDSYNKPEFTITK